MENLDLNIHNYNLEDITNLFHIPTHFTKEDLKKCQKNCIKNAPG